MDVETTVRSLVTFLPLRDLTVECEKPPVAEEETDDQPSQRIFFVLSTQPPEDLARWCEAVMTEPSFAAHHRKAHKRWLDRCVEDASAGRTCVLPRTAADRKSVFVSGYYYNTALLMEMQRGCLDQECRGHDDLEEMLWSYRRTTWVLPYLEIANTEGGTADIDERANEAKILLYERAADDSDGRVVEAMKAYASWISLREERLRTTSKSSIALTATLDLVCRGYFCTQHYASMEVVEVCDLIETLRSQ